MEKHLACQICMFTHTQDDSRLRCHLILAHGGSIENGLLQSVPLVTPMEVTGVWTRGARHGGGFYAEMCHGVPKTDTHSRFDCALTAKRTGDGTVLWHQQPVTPYRVATESTHAWERSTNPFLLPQTIWRSFVELRLEKWSGSIAWVSTTSSNLRAGQILRPLPSQTHSACQPRPSPTIAGLSRLKTLSFQYQCQRPSHLFSANQQRRCRHPDWLGHRYPWR